MIQKYGIFKVMDISFVCPEAAPKQGEIVAAILPLKKVDPFNRFCYVINSEGDTITMSRKFMNQIDVTTVILPEFRLLTAAQEQAKIWAAVKNDFINYINEHHESAKA